MSRTTDQRKLLFENSQEYRRLYHKGLFFLGFGGIILFAGSIMDNMYIFILGAVVLTVSNNIDGVIDSTIILREISEDKGDKFN